MDKVYKARDTRLDRTVAIKTRAVFRTRKLLTEILLVRVLPDESMLAFV